jgi:hypothetical protein
MVLLAARVVEIKIFLLPLVMLLNYENSYTLVWLNRMEPRRLYALL